MGIIRDAIRLARQTGRDYFKIKDHLKRGPLGATTIWSDGKQSRQFQQKLITKYMKRKWVSGGKDSSGVPKKKMRKGSKRYGKKKRNTKVKAYRKLSKKGSKRILANGYLTTFTIRNRKQTIKNISNKNVVQTKRNFSFWTTAAPGRQEATVIGDITQSCTANQLDFINFYNTGAKFYNYITNTWITGDARIGTELVADSSGKKIYIDTITGSLVLTNQGPTSLEYDLYYLMPRNSLKTGTLTAPISAWTNGLLAEQGNAATAQQRTYIDSKPTDSKDFNFEWKVVKKVIGKMDPGTENKIVMTYKMNRFMDTNYLNIHGCSRYSYPIVPMIVQRGIPADSSNTPETAAIVSTSRTKLIGIMSTTINGYVCDTRQSFSADLGPPLGTLALGTGSMLSIADAAGTVVNSNVAVNFA